MIDTRKILPAEAELSAGAAGSDAEKHMDNKGRFTVSLVDVVLYGKMRELALRAAGWHMRCVSGLPGESA